MESAIQFATKNQQSKWHISDETKTLLGSIDEQIVPVEIIGPYRTGKSYLLNRLADLPSFAVGDDVEAMTKGIWIRVIPHPTQTDKKLILLDTEGLNDIKKDEQKQEDIELFCLILLLCSLIIFNVTRTLDGDFLQNLSLVSEISDTVIAEEGKSDDYLSQYFPQLMVLIRDMELKLKLKGKQVTPLEYLEDSLECKSGTSRKIFEFNLPRLCVKKFFPKRCCYTLPRPFEDTDEGEERMRTSPKFEREFRCLKKHVFEKAKPMRLHNTVLKGTAYVEFAEGIIESINSKQIPNIETTIASVAEKDGQRALEKGIDTYRQDMAEVESQMPVEDAVMAGYHDKSRANALSVFENATTLKKHGSYEEFCSKFQEQTQMTYQLLTMKNHERSNAVCQSAITESFADLESRLSKREFSCKGGSKKYKEHKEKATTDYEKRQHLGPAKTMCLEAKLKGLAGTEETIISMDEALTEEEKKTHMQAERAKQAETAQKLAEEEKQRAVDLEKKQTKENKEIIENMKKQHKQEMDEKEKRNDDSIKSKQQQIDDLTKQGLDVDEIKKELSEMKKEKESLLAEHRMRQRQYDQMVLEGEQNYQIMRGVGGLIGGLFSAALQ